jgi:ATP-dependent HslUV protease ATP-binding subunit HslU
LILQVENIGARRLHTVLERLVEDISFEAPDIVADLDETLPESFGGPEELAKQPNCRTPDGLLDAQAIYEVALKKVRDFDSAPRSEQLKSYANQEEYLYKHVVDKEHVRDKLQGLLQQDDLSKYIL